MDETARRDAAIAEGSGCEECASLRERAEAWREAERYWKKAALDMRKELDDYYGLHYDIKIAEAECATDRARKLGDK